MSQLCRRRRRLRVPDLSWQKTGDFKKKKTKLKHKGLGVGESGSNPGTAEGGGEREKERKRPGVGDRERRERQEGRSGIECSKMTDCSVWFIQYPLPCPAE